MLQIVRFQIPHQKIAERALPDGRQPILITPDSVNGIQLLGGDRHIRLQPDIAGGLHKVDGIVGVTLDVLPIVQRSGAFRESEAVCRKPLQALKRPEKNALDLSLHLLGNVRIVHTISRLLFCGQDQLTAVKTVAAVVERLQIAVGERQQAGVHPPLIALDAFAFQIHLALCGNDGFDISSSTRR